jgi:hypothetical protein
MESKEEIDPELSFYYPKSVLASHQVPIIATCKNTSVLESEVAYQFMGKDRIDQFRFRMSYFEQDLESLHKVDSAIVITSTDISDTLRLKKNTIYQLNAPLYLDSSAILIMEEGAQLYIDDAIDIISKGRIEINGTADNPALITALNQHWGGIQSYGGAIDLKHVIITHAGGNDSIKVRHSYSQPAIYMIENGVFKASHLAIINCLGKAMYINGSFVKIKRSLFADCDTGPEINWSRLVLDSIICMNIPDAKNGEDDDNDALYIYGRHPNHPAIPPHISNVLLGFSKDDGFDHGKNDMQVNNLLVYQVKDKAISLEGGHMELNNVFLSHARVLVGVKQDTHAVIDSIYLGEGMKTDILENMQQDPTLELKNELEIDDMEEIAARFWFSIY